METFGYEPGGAQEYVLVRKGHGTGHEKCGWLKVEILVPWNEDGRILPIRQSDAPRGTDFYVPNSPITLKAVVHNLKVAGDTVPIYSKPDLDKDKVIRRLKQFEFLDIFKVAVDPRTRRNRPSRRKYFFLVGRKAVAGRDPEIFGWAHQDHITIWTTRMAASWTGKGGFAYDRPVHGSKVMALPMGTPDSGNQVDKKYPVLTTRPDAERLSQIVGRIRNPTFQNILRRLENVKLVAPGKACADDGSDCLRTLPVWVPPIQNGKQVIDFWLMVSLANAGRLYQVAKSLCRFRSSEHGARRLKRALEMATCIAAGEDNETCQSQSPADVLHRGFFIPAWALADILGKPWDKLDSYIQT